MSHKLGTEETQRGTSRALSIRVPDDMYATIIDLEDRSNMSKSQIGRAFFSAGLEQLETDNPKKMHRDVEYLWRELKEAKPRSRVRQTMGRRTAATRDEIVNPAASDNARLDQLEATMGTMAEILKKLADGK